MSVKACGAFAGEQGGSAPQSPRVRVIRNSTPEKGIFCTVSTADPWGSSRGWLVLVFVKDLNRRYSVVVVKSFLIQV